MPRSRFGIRHQVAGEGLEVRHLAGVLGRDDEAEMMPVVLASLGEGAIVGVVARGIEHPRLLSVAGDALALQIGEMRRQRRRSKAAALVADDARLDDDAAARIEEAGAAEGGAPAPEAGAAGGSRIARRYAASQVRPCARLSAPERRSSSASARASSGPGPAGRGSRSPSGSSDRLAEANGSRENVVCRSRPCNSTRICRNLPTTDRPARRKTSRDSDLSAGVAGAFISPSCGRVLR